MKNVRSVQVTLEQKDVPRLQGNKPGKAEWGQSNPAHKSTGSYSLSVKPFCGSRNFLPDQGTQAGYGEIQLTPPPRGTSENKLITKRGKKTGALCPSVSFGQAVPSSLQAHLPCARPQMLYSWNTGQSLTCTSPLLWHLSPAQPDR